VKKFSENSSGTGLGLNGMVSVASAVEKNLLVIIRFEFWVLWRIVKFLADMKLALGRDAGKLRGSCLEMALDSVFNNICFVENFIFYVLYSSGFDL
jgi:hypothetical protein